MKLHINAKARMASTAFPLYAVSRIDRTGAGQFLIAHYLARVMTTHNDAFYIHDTF